MRVFPENGKFHFSDNCGELRTLSSHDAEKKIYLRDRDCCADDRRQ